MLVAPARLAIASATAEARRRRIECFPVMQQSGESAFFFVPLVSFVVEPFAL
jgi:hypothetical protein